MQLQWKLDWKSLPLQGAFTEGRQVLLQFDAAAGTTVGSPTELAVFLRLASQARQQRGGATGAGPEAVATALATAPEQGLLFVATSAGALLHRSHDARSVATLPLRPWINAALRVCG